MNLRQHKRCAVAGMAHRAIHCGAVFRVHGWYMVLEWRLRINPEGRRRWLQRDSMVFRPS